MRDVEKVRIERMIFNKMVGVVFSLAVCMWGAIHIAPHSWVLTFLVILAGLLVSSRLISVIDRYVNLFSIVSRKKDGNG